jgi:hypothetical protein
MEYKCPACGSVIYSRRNPLCGVCAKPLPKELLFTTEERMVVERELEEAKRRADAVHEENKIPIPRPTLPDLRG